MKRRVSSQPLLASVVKDMLALLFHQADIFAEAHGVDAKEAMPYEMTAYSPARR